MNLPNYLLVTIAIVIPGCTIDANSRNKMFDESVIEHWHNKRYIIQVNDVLDLHIMELLLPGEFESQVVVDHEGMVYVEGIGRVRLAGLERCFAEQLIARLLENSHLLRSPYVKITVKRGSVPPIISDANP